VEDILTPARRHSNIAPGPNGETLEEIGAVYVLPGSKLTFEIPLRLEDTEDFTDLVNDFIELYQLDFLLIDTSPTLSIWDGIIYDAVDGALFISECDPGSLAGIQECYDRIERKNARRKKRGRRRPIDLLGVIPNKFIGGREQSLNMGFLGQAFGDKVFSVVPSYKTISRSVNYGQTVRANVRYNSVASQIIYDTVSRVEQELEQVVYARTT
jgi:cellulose biosynthesis protein BcsQ